MNLLISHSSSPNPNKQIHNASQLFRTRLIARSCVALACLVQLLSRLILVASNNSASDKAPGGLVVIAILFAPLMTLTVIIEYILFRKFGSGVLRFSILVDLILLTLFIGDWATGVISFLLKTQEPDPPLFSVSALYGFISFAWRALLLTLIVQKWQLKILAPIVIAAITTGYAIHDDREHAASYLVRCATQLFNVVLVFYCEDKIKWRMIWVNLEQEKWMQVNNFILNNIPENIMILDVKGDVKFVSEHCKNFMEKCQNTSLDIKGFFNKIQNIQQLCQEDELNSPRAHAHAHEERLTTEKELLPETHEEFTILTDLITNFKSIVRDKNLQERQFLIYNGKLKLGSHNEKSIEIKISFLQHSKSEYIILILRDTTKRDLLVTLEKTNQYKDQLLASVSHELRTPLNGNINFIDGAINSPRIPQNIKETLLIPALRSSKFLLSLINDILDMSQIKENKLRLNYQPGDIKETLKSTAQLIELQAKKKGIELILELDPDLPSQFCTDHMRLSQIVLNLLSNAMKFTNKGTVKLTATPMHQNQWIQICVQDSGIGMSEENIAKLFSNYTRIEFEGRQSMNPTGVGLGLNIAYKLVQFLAPPAHQRIKVSSVLSQGSTFSFVLENKINPPASSSFFADSNNNSYSIADESPGDKNPILLQKLHPKNRSDSRSKSNNSEPEMSPGACQCPEILIVDDNPFNTMALETVLSSLNVKSDSVFSGSSAIEKLLLCRKKNCEKDCKKYSVVFMDQEMVEMSGIETVKEIRKLQKEGRLSAVEIIGCTAHQSNEEVEKFLQAGLDQCIHKPISAAMIKKIL